MTRTAKLNAPTIPFDRPAPVVRAATARQPSWPALEASSPQAVDNALVAELESALQAVVAREPRPQAAAPFDREAVLPVDPSGEAEAPDRAWQGSGAGSSNPVRQPYLLLGPAEAPAPARTVSWELDTPADQRRPGTGEARRRRLPLRAALCVAGLAGLVGAGGAALMFAAAPGNELAAPVAKPVRTETIRAAAAPAAMRPQPAAAERVTASEHPIAAGAPAGTAAGETPAAEVTLLRPVGESRTAAATVQPAEGSPLVQGQPQADATGASQTVKAPDRLVEAPAAPFRDGAEEARSRRTGSAAGPAAGATERLSSEAPATADETIVAAVPMPLSEEALVARTAPEAAEEGTTDATASGRPDGVDELERQQELAAEVPGSADLPGPAEAAAVGEPTRTAPVTTAVNMRGGPDNDAAVLTVVPAGSEVEVIGCDYWCEVVFGGERGWIYKSFVSGADS